MALWEDEGFDSYNDWKNNTSANERFWQEEQGLKKVSKTRTWEEAMEAGDVGAQLGSNVQFHQDIISQTQAEIDRRKAEGLTGSYEFQSDAATARGYGRSGQGVDIAGLEGAITGYQSALGELQDPYLSYYDYEKTDERLAQEEQAQSFADKQLGLFDMQMDSLQQQIEAFSSRQDAWEQQQVDYADLMSSTTRKLEAYQSGEAELPPAMQQQKQEEWERFKESRAQIGQVVEGDTPEDSTAQGTNAEQALRAFKEQWQSRQDATLHNMMMQEAGLLQGGIGQMGAMNTLGNVQLGGFGASQPGIAGTGPSQYEPNLMGMQAMGMGSQPYQFNQQMDLQRQQLQMQQQQINQQSGSGMYTLGGALIGAAGSAYGGYLGGQAAGTVYNQYGG